MDILSHSRSLLDRQTSLDHDQSSVSIHVTSAQHSTGSEVFLVITQVEAHTPYVRVLSFGDSRFVICKAAALSPWVANVLHLTASRLAALRECHRHGRLFPFQYWAQSPCPSPRTSFLLPPPFRSHKRHAQRPVPSGGTSVCDTPALYCARNERACHVADMRATNPDSPS
jgi:hypothetical protein